MNSVQKTLEKTVLLMILSVFCFVRMVLAQGVIDLPKTGQNISYAVGDDGDLQVGANWPVPRFIDNGDSTITDRLTGLMWTKNANVLGRIKNYWDALDYVLEMNNDEHQNFGYTDWRMPNILEIESLYNYGHPNNVDWLSIQSFTQVQLCYWSSSGGRGDHTPTITFSQGLGCPGPKIYYNSLWPVRSTGSGTIQLPKTGVIWSEEEGDDGDLQMGVDWPDPRFIDGGNGTVRDSLTGLMWTKNANLPNDRMDWGGALDFVASLNNDEYLGYGDWRLPSVRELASLEWYVGNVTANDPSDPFTNIPPYPAWGVGTWTSTTCAYDPDRAWGIWLQWSSAVWSFKKTAQCYVWPVRTSEFVLLSSDIESRHNLPTEYALSQNYPNPFNLTTIIRYTIPHTGRNTQDSKYTTLIIYNILGQEVRSLVDSAQGSGYYTVTWDGKDNVGNLLSSGIYFYCLLAVETPRDNRCDFKATRSMLLMK